MTRKDHLKLIRAGFMIIRSSSTPIYAGGKVVGSMHSIKYKDHHHLEWSVYEKDIPSKAALQRRIDALLQDEKTIEE